MLPQRRPAPSVRGPFRDRVVHPGASSAPTGQHAAVFHVEPGYIALDTYDVLNQQLVSHQVRCDDAGQARVWRSPHRDIWPAELDLMAQLAGFELESRHADWSNGEFTPESHQHASVYRLSSQSDRL